MKKIYCAGIKRLLDITFSIIAIILFLWLYILIALMVRIKLGSPVIFAQERPGKIDPETGNEKIFRLYKFRSMSNARGEDGKLLPDKERITKFGHILRSSSMDELPEVWNILKGDMSIVGPRPWAVSYLKYFTTEERRRHFVRPGLTGLAQVHGRTSLNWDERLKYDIEYVNHISFLLDLKVIWLTIKKVISRADLVEAGYQGNFDDYRKKQWEEGTVVKPGDVE